ncbi:MAG TPA: Hsp20/alpha crystallin family protein [Methylocella sp.]|nr:Hsp20/alpha crystallin family protein [Methylocella sp.]
MAEAQKLEVKTEKKATTMPAPVGQTAPFEALRREIDRLFDNFHEGAWRLPFGRPVFDLELLWPRGTGWAIAPAVDVTEKEKEYEITAELPGMDEKDIEIKLSNGTLTIKGEKKEEKEEREKDYYLSERRYGSFLRSFRVPEGVDAAKIEATFAKGVLTLKLPKTAEAQKAEKTIAIKAA